MTSKHAFGRARLALILGAFVLSACGSSTPSATAVVTPAPTVAAVVTPAPTPSPTPAPTPSPTPVPTPTAEPEIDPADDLEVAAPYTLVPLEGPLAELFITSMEESMGAFADVFHVGVRSAVRDGETIAWVIVMEFPDLPMSDTALLDGAAAGAADGGEVEKRRILDRPVRIVEQDGLTAVITVVDNDLIMAMAEGKTRAVNVITAILEASE